MKVNPVKQFVASNITKIEKRKDALKRSFNLYDKSNLFRGEYNFIPLNKSGRLGVKTSLSTTHIMDDCRKKEMSEFVFMNKKYVTVKDKTSDTLTKALPSEINILTTVLDYVNDKFKTIRTVSRLQNKLQKAGLDDIDLMLSKDSVVYKELAEKPCYEKTTEIIREGSISGMKNTHFSINIGAPYIFW